MSTPRSLWVCYVTPTNDDLGAPVLSFMSPRDEEEFAKTHRGLLARAREVSTDVREEARQIYYSVVSAIGLSRTRNGVTFRQALQRHGHASQWWYHRTSFRDSESSPVFAWIIATLTIRNLADKLEVAEIVMVGGPPEVAATLRCRFAVRELSRQHRGGTISVLARGFASRVRYLAGAARRLFGIKRTAADPAAHFDVMLAGFLGWSLAFESSPDPIDRYFKRLPDELQRRNLSYGWLASLDDDGVGGNGRSRAAILAGLRPDSRVLILQSYLRAADLVKALTDLRGLIAFARHSRTKEYCEAFLVGGLDFRPIFARDLLHGFASEHIPRCELIAIATERACRSRRPRFLLTFLEHFPHSRAQYEGLRRAGLNATAATMQHASYSREKTFLHLDPRTEFAGEPEGCAVPHCQLVFAMGSFSEELFRACGYPDNAVLSTGSARYDGLTLRSASGGRSDSLRILMVCSLDIDTEMAMIEAVVLAAETIRNCDLRVRSHPFRKVESHRDFARVADRITISSSSLDDDLSRADVVVFTYSTVAEEAFMRGKAVWQWLPTGFNGSALAEVARIPQFGRIATMREALESFQRDPRPWLPDTAAQQKVLERLFHAADGSAGRIAERIAACL